MKVYLKAELGNLKALDFTFKGLRHHYLNEDNILVINGMVVSKESYYTEEELKKILAHWTFELIGKIDEK